MERAECERHLAAERRNARMLGDWVSEVLPKVAKQNARPCNCSNNATRYVGPSSALRPETSQPSLEPRYLLKHTFPSAWGVNMRWGAHDSDHEDTYNMIYLKYYFWQTEENHKKKLKLNSMVWVRERTIPTERPLLVGEVSVNFCG
jgi:hypothetical protein